MIVTPLSINNLWWEAFIQKNSSHIPMRKRENEVLVEGLLGGSFLLDLPILEKKSVFLLSALKKMPKGIRKSVLPSGIAWFNARHLDRVELDLETLQRLLIMCIALGFIHVVDNVHYDCITPFIMMDDADIVRREKTKKGKKRTILMRWFA